ncbi:ABC transporter permease [Ideonella paludis]|uniref:ABC transporter permease n=1 Tax=Ideonella paludis TaxID=1233411 RepID=A0ABS5DRY5_9BURK|nr:ABC transporter permease [Ideonella paludis]
MSPQGQAHIAPSATPPLPATLGQRALRHRSFMLGAVLVALVAGVALLSLVWQPYPPAELDIPNKLQGPSSLHWLGTDSLGRDIASQLMVGAQSALMVGLLAVGWGLVLGLALGLLAAARRGWVDEVLMRAVDFGFAFPALLTAILLAAAQGPGLATSIIAIGLFNIPVFMRVTRAAALNVWARDYILAARLSGLGTWAITRSHVLPNIAAPLIVQATIQCALAILAEAALAFLGLGTQAPQPSWGRMLADAQLQLFNAPLLALWPGLAIATTVLGLNLLGDGLRDLLDPKLRHR